MKKYISIIIIVFIVPSIAFASWWNPFSWNIFSFLHKKDVVPQAQIIETQTTPENIIIETEPEITPTPVQENKEVKKDTPVVNNLPVDKTKIELSNTEQTKLVSTKELEYQKILSIRKNGGIFGENQPGYQIMQEFMKNPTIENFKIFCSSAKNIDSNTTKQVMSEDRESLMAVKLSLYDELNYCKIFSENPNFLITLDENLFVHLNDNDSDDVRESKLILNDKIRNLIDTSSVKFVRFNAPESVSSPTELFQYYLYWFNHQQKLNLERGDDFAIENTKENLEIELKNISLVIEDVSNYFYK